MKYEKVNFLARNMGTSNAADYRCNLQASVSQACEPLSR